MRRIMILCLVVMALSFMTACTQEPDPVQQPLRQSSADADKPAAEEVDKKIDETVPAVKAEAAKQVEDVKKEAADDVAQPPASVAAGVDATGPDLVNYDASQGMVIFNHTEHSSRLACSDCHSTDPPQKIVINKETGHDLCRGCHKGVSNAPKSCSGCHIK